MTAATDQLTTEAPEATTHQCPVCGATTGLRRLNDIAPDVKTPSTAPDYFACANAEDCINRAMKAAADLIMPDAETDTDEPDTQSDTEPADDADTTEPDTEPGD
jgi:hypothetical protein